MIDKWIKKMHMHVGTYICNFDNMDEPEVYYSKWNTNFYLPQLIFATTYICIHTHIYVYNNNDRFLDAVFS